MAIVFKEIQNLGTGEQPDLFHANDNNAHILYTQDGKLYLQTTETPMGTWTDRELTDELGVTLDNDIDNFTVNKLHGFGGVGSYSTPNSQYLLLYGTEQLDKVSYETIITSIEHDYDNNNLKITISNKSYLNDDLNYLTALWANSKQTSTNVNISSGSWNTSTKKVAILEEEAQKPIDINTKEIFIEQKDDVNDLIQQAQITRRGIYTRDSDDADGQMRIFSDKIVFTRDNWATYSVAIDSLGIKTSGSFKLITDNSIGGNNLVTIDGNGIKIYGDGSIGNGLEVFNKLNERTFYLDTNGNANFTGIITGGTIRTAESGAMIRLQGNKLETFNSSGNLSGLVSVPFSSTYTDLKIYSNGNIGLEFYDTLSDGLQIRPVDFASMFIGGAGKNMYGYGNWYFSSTQSVNGLNTTSNGSHSHTVVVDGVTYTTSSSGSHNHDVKKA
jgi:frataxin-like iron-binding protein CyaY